MAGDVVSTAAQYFSELGRLAGQLDHAGVERFASMLFEAWRADRAVYVLGNGGSAYTASHFVTDFVKTAQVPGLHRLRTFSLVDNYGLTTALGNDAAFDQTLVHPLESYARPGDMVVAISCSGNSPNVVRACEHARAARLPLVALTGFTGGAIAALADLHLHVPSRNYGLIEDLHLSIGHTATQLLMSKVAASRGPRA